MTRILRATAAVAAVMALAPAAATAAPRTSDIPVCNQASPHFQGGGLVALDPPVDSPAARYTTNLTRMPGRGAGLLVAAPHSPALTICGEGPATPGGEETPGGTETPGGETPSGPGTGLPGDGGISYT